jgi:hypothetical protein
VTRRLRAPLALLACVLIGTLIGLSGAGAKTTSKGPSPNAAKVIHACYAINGGAVRFLGAHARCLGSERSITFNQKGPAGPRGLTGPHGPIGATGVAGPTGPANTEVVAGPVVTLAGSQQTGQVAISTAGCDHAVTGANREAYGGGVVVTPHPATPVPEIVPLQASYPGNGVTGNTQALPPSAGQGADAWTGVAVIDRMVNPNDSATVQTYVICGP